MYIYTHMYLSIHTYMVQSIYVQLILSCVSDGKESSKKPGFNAWVRKITWRRKWQPTSIPAWRISWTEKPGGLHSPWGCKESDMTEQLTLSFKVQSN